MIIIGINLDKRVFLPQVFGFFLRNIETDL